MPEQSNDYRVAIFGTGGVGKSSLVQRFVNGCFAETYVPTIEDTYRQVISCNRQQNVCTLQITDTTGSHQFPAMQRLSISRAHAIVLVFTVDKGDSLRELEPIYHEVQAIKGRQMDDTPVMLVGNKCDCQESSRKVRPEVGKAMADRWGAGFVETSAKADINVREMFEMLLALEKRRQVGLTAETGSQKRKKLRKESKKRKEAQKQAEKAAAKTKKPEEPAKEGENAAKKCTLM